MTVMHTLRRVGAGWPGWETLAWHNRMTIGLSREEQGGKAGDSREVPPTREGDGPRAACVCSYVPPQQAAACDAADGLSGRAGPTCMLKRPHKRPSQLIC